MFSGVVMSMGLAWGLNLVVGVELKRRSDHHPNRYQHMTIYLERR